MRTTTASTLDKHEGKDKDEDPNILHLPLQMDDQPEFLQVTGGQKLPEVGLCQATDGQPELPQHLNV